jgi:hypothetical protein
LCCLYSDILDVGKINKLSVEETFYLIKILHFSRLVIKCFRDLEQKFVVVKS